MVDTLRAALRLLPVVKPSFGGTCGTCSRVPKARLHSPPEQSTLLALRVQPQLVHCERTHRGTGIARFARAVLAYVGAGLSAVTANQLIGPSICQAKELGSSVGENHMMAAAEARAVWQRTAANRHLVQEDALRSPKFAHCPLPHIVSKTQTTDVCHPVSHSYHWSNSSWSSIDARVSLDGKVDLQWQLSPSSHKDCRSELVGIDESLSTRLSKPAGLQALAAESNVATMKSNVGLMGVPSEYSPATDLELEWQLIVDPKPKLGFPASICENSVCEEDTGLVFQEPVNSEKDPDELATLEQVNTCKASASEIMTKGKKETARAGSYAEACLDKMQTSLKRGSALSEISEYQDTSSKSSKRVSPSWRTADKQALAALVAQKAAEPLENCDLPTPQAMSMLKSTLATFDISPSEKQGDVSRSMDKALLASLLRGNEPTRLENLGLPSYPLSSGITDPSPPVGPPTFHRVSQPRIIPSVEASPSTRRGSHSFSADSRNTSWNGGGNSSAVERGPGLLGEALCHSQTRAREAEKRVELAIKEKERLVHLFFQEASLSLTYRHWVTSLQAENMWLRMYAGDEPIKWLEHSFFNPFSAFERFSGNRWRNFGKEHARRQMEHQLSMWPGKDLVWQGDTNDIMMGCTLGFAFALGLSLAGAGLMLGWSMGWILLAY